MNVAVSEHIAVGTALEELLSNRRYCISKRSLYYGREIMVQLRTNI